MDLNLESAKRQEFRDILVTLASSQAILEQKKQRAATYKDLEELYGSSSDNCKFRHFYSDIFPILTAIKNDPNMGDLDVLCQNLDIIRKGYQVKNLDNDGNPLDISDSLNKLYDHINLEIARINYSDREISSKSGRGELNDVKGRITALHSSLSKLDEKQIETSEKLHNQQKEYITILGIFASIVIAFMGGIMFSSSVLANILHANIFKLSFVVSLLGYILTNTIFMLEKFIFIINNSPTDTLKPKYLDFSFLFIALVSLILFFLTK